MSSSEDIAALRDQINALSIKVSSLERNVELPRGIISDADLPLVIAKGGTGGGDAATARDNLDALQGMQEIDDWNDATEPGFYWSRSLTNAPQGLSTSWFSGFVVVNGTGSDARYLQQVRPAKTGFDQHLYQRYWNLTSWTDWEDLGALPIGNTTGDLPVSRLSGNLPLSQTSGTIGLERVVHGNVNDSVSRIYIGTGSNATGARQAYIGMSSLDGTSASSFWFAVNSSTVVQIMPNGDIQTTGKLVPGDVSGTFNALGVGSFPVLWSGAIHMQDGQTAPLSQKVSAQPNGICLVWSAYASGTAQDNTWTYSWIPKMHVTLPGSGGILCPLAVNNNTSPTPISKYVYVTDSQVSGYAENSKGQGATRVLRYVLGW